MVSSESITAAELDCEIAADLARKGLRTRAVDTRVDLTTQIAAQSAVAHHLGTDLARERAARNAGDQCAWRFRWESHAAGVHRVTASSLGVRLTFDVDLVINRVTEVA